MASYRSNNPRPELRPLLRKWEGNPAVNRGRDAPHMKTYVRYREVEGSGENGETIASFGCGGGGRACNAGQMCWETGRFGNANRQCLFFGFVILA